MFITFSGMVDEFSYAFSHSTENAVQMWIYLPCHIPIVRWTIQWSFPEQDFMLVWSELEYIVSFIQRRKRMTCLNSSWID